MKNNTGFIKIKTGFSRPFSVLFKGFWLQKPFI
jgi:hypothetical protein